MSDFTKILPVTLKFEGLWANNKRDPGGCTMKGIILTTYRQYKPGATPADLRSISDAEVEHIYDVGYFKPIGGASLSQGVAMVSFDYGVNSGTGRAIKVLQQTSSLTGAIRVRKICDSRLSFLHALKTWSYFGKGWGTRVGEVEAIGLKWESYSPTFTKAEIAVSENDARKKVKQHTAVAVASTTTATTVPVTPVKQLPVAAVAGGSGVLIAVSLICGLFAFHNSQRANALKAA